MKDVADWALEFPRVYVPNGTFTALVHAIQHDAIMSAADLVDDIDLEDAPYDPTPPHVVVNQIRELTPKGPGE